MITTNQTKESNLGLPKDQQEMKAFAVGGPYPYTAKRMVNEFLKYKNPQENDRTEWSDQKIPDENRPKLHHRLEDTQVWKTKCPFFQKETRSKEPQKK